MTELLRILYLEDTKADFEFCLRTLERGGLKVKVDHVVNEEQFRERLNSGVYDIVLADYRIPGWTGMAAFQFLRASGVDTPLVPVNRYLGGELAADCLKQRN